MSERSIRRILVVGAGTMGQQISLQCAAFGFDVVLNDVSQDRLSLAEASLDKLAAQMTHELELPNGYLDSALSRIERIADPTAAAEDTDLLSESVPEDLKLKRRVFAQFHSLCPPHTLFTTNSSTLLPSELAKASQRPDQFAALHFHPNVWESSVVDISPTRTVAPEITEQLRQFAIEIGQIPIVLENEQRGFVVNRFLVGIFRQALNMAAKGIATPEDIDRAFMGVLRCNAGPFGLMDRVGLDTMQSINTFWCKRLLLLPHLEPVNRRNRRFLQAYIDRGELGVKSGQGFYMHPNPEYQQPEFLAHRKQNPDNGAG